MADVLGATIEQSQKYVPAGPSHEVLTVQFFFSSRRRHTICSRDWSSDVCSSDLLREGFAHHADGDAQDLDVHLQRGDARASAGDFEVHVAVMIFGSGDVREDGVFLADRKSVV